MTFHDPRRPSPQLHEATHELPLNGSRKLPDFYFRNWGVAYSQLLSLDASAESTAALKQHAMGAFLKWAGWADDG